MTDIINLINDFGQSNPERVAVRHKDEELTYQQLMDESSKLAHLLQDNHKPLIVYGHMSPHVSRNDRCYQSRLWLCTY